MRVILLIFFSVFCLSFAGFATHNRAGEITYKKVNEDPNDFQYEITIVTCTKASSPADRPWLELRFGDEPLDAELDSIERVDAIPPLGVINADDSRINVYRTLHTYPGPGSYILSMEDPNRNGGVINMDESIGQVFYIESLLVINPFLGHNNSVSLLYEAKDEACVNAIWEHNPGAFDIDGDSLVYSLVPCKGVLGLDIASWESPELIPASEDIDDSFTINPLTGTIMWDAPGIAGEYNIAIKIEEFRSGFLMGYVVRDMQVKVLNCPNEPPVVSIVQDTCIVAGEEAEYFISATDSGSAVELQAVGAPMTEVTNLAQFSTTPGNPATGQFEWVPGCEEVRLAPYQVLFIGEDTGASITNLVDIMEVNITVIAPAVENFTVEPNGLSFDLSWDEHECSQVISYKLFRRQGVYGYEPAYCETGLPEYTGYELIATLDAPASSFNDSDDIDFGLETCYVIVACLANGSESIASEETCSLITDLTTPLITTVSVLETGVTSGRDSITWSGPLSADTVNYVAPYTMRLYHGESFGSAENLIFETAESPFIGSLQSFYIHETINTSDTPNAYRAELVDANGQEISSNPCSSTFLSITPDDNQLTLEWDFDVSWLNVNYDIYRKAQGETDFSFLASSPIPTYTDENLTNQEEYCYLVEATGTFNAPTTSLPEPTVNLSQEVCSQPVDLTAPCAPTLVADGSCEEGEVNLEWNNPNESCADDVTGYYIYFKPFTDSEYILLDSIDTADETTYDFISPTNITGCFYVTALDSVLPGLDGLPNRNESVPSQEFCFESCPEYELPNVITPQGDGLNDFFEPFPYQYIDSIDLVIYNRWGTPVFETKNPDILWDGTNKDTSKISADGVYFYTISIFSSKLTGVIEEKRTGNFTVLSAEKFDNN